MHLNKLDYLTSAVASLSFVAGFLIVFVLIGYGLGSIVPWSHQTDAGFLLGPLAFALALPCAWLGSYLALRYFLRRTRQQNFKETYGNFAGLVIVSFVITTIVGSVNSRAFVTMPTLFLSLAAAYVMARLIVVRKLRK